MKDWHKSGICLLVYQYESMQYWYLKVYRKNDIEIYRLSEKILMLVRKPIFRKMRSIFKTLIFYLNVYLR
jgi:hypothetical protein